MYVLPTDSVVQVSQSVRCVFVCVPEQSLLNYVPRTNLHFGSHSFHIAPPTIWNTLPSTLHSSQTLHTLMWSNNNCSICRLLDWFPCFYHRTEQGNRRQRTSLRPRCGIARWTIYFRNLSPFNAKLTLLSCVHASSQTVMRLNMGQRAFPAPVTIH